MESVAEVIGVPVAQHDDLHVGRIEAECLEARQQLRLEEVRAERVDHQQARGRVQDIDGGAGVADGVDVVEEFRRRDRRVGRGVGARRLAEEVGFVGPRRAGSFLGLFDYRRHGGRVGPGRSRRWRLCEGGHRHRRRQGQAKSRSR